MHTLFLIPESFSGKDYVSIESITEVRPLKLVYYENLLEDSCKISVKYLREIEKTINRTDKEKYFILNCFKWNKELFNIQSFDILIESIQKKLDLIQKEMKILQEETNDKFGLFCKEENYEFLSCIYCKVNVKDIKKFENLFTIGNSKTIKEVKRLDEEILYLVYCMKEERQQMKDWLKLNEIAIYKPTTVVKERNNKEGRILDLYKEVLEMVMTVHMARGLSEGLNKYGLSSGFKYKIVERSEENDEFESLKRSYKGVSLGEGISIVPMDI